MTRYFFPLLIVATTVALVGPFAVDFVGGLTMGIATDTAAQIQGLK